MNSPSSPDVTAFLDNSDPGHTLSQYLQQTVPARPAAVHLYGLRLWAGVAVSGRVAGPAGSASRGPAADGDAAQRLEVPTLYRFTRVFSERESMGACGSADPPRVWSGQRGRGRLSAAV